MTTSTKQFLSGLALTASILLLVASCSKSDTSPQAQVLKREGEPDFVRVDDDKQMDAAVAKARKSISEFIAALQTPAATDRNFSVKKPFKVADGEEHIWLVNVNFDGKNFHGEVGNEPVDVKNIKLGEKVTVSKSEASDWMFVRNGKLMGGYTVRALYDRSSPEEKKELLKHVDFKLD